MDRTGMERSEQQHPSCGAALATGIPIGLLIFAVFMGVTWALGPYQDWSHLEEIGWVTPKEQLGMNHLELTGFWNAYLFDARYDSRPRPASYDRFITELSNVATDTATAVGASNHAFRSRAMSDDPYTIALVWERTDAHPVYKAVSMIRHASSNGDAVAQFLRGMAYLVGIPKPADSAEARQWLPSSARGGNGVDRMLREFLAYNSGGWSVLRDTGKAAFWFRSSAEQGFGPAADALAELCQDGVVECSEDEVAGTRI